MADDITLERAYYEDIDDVLALYRACALYSDLRSEAHWDEEYPTFEMAESDLDMNGLFVVRDGGRIIAAVSILPGNATFDGVSGKSSPCETSVITRLCVHPERQRMGLGSRVLDLSLERSIQLGCRKICLMCSTNDVVMRKMCRRLGFNNTGIRRLYRRAFLMMERTI